MAQGATAERRICCVGCLGQCGKKSTLRWLSGPARGSSLSTSFSILSSSLFPPCRFSSSSSSDFGFQFVSVFESFTLSSSISIFGSHSFLVIRFFFHFFDFIFFWFSFVLFTIPVFKFSCLRGNCSTHGLRMMSLVVGSRFSFLRS